MEPQLDSGLESEGFFTVRELPAVPARSRIPLHGNCRIARESDIQAYLNPSEDEGHTLLNDVSFLLESADGRSLRGVFKHPFYMPAEIRRRNVLVIGQTGRERLRITLSQWRHQTFRVLARRWSSSTAKATFIRSFRHSWNAIGRVQGSR